MKMDFVQFIRLHGVPEMLNVKRDLIMEEDKLKKIEEEKIRQDPYNYICDYVESVYPKTGRKVFEVLALMPPSLIIPDFKFMGKLIRSNIHALFLASSGSGKTSLSDLFATFTYSPLKLESVTSAGLENLINELPMFSLIVGDFARMSADRTLIKVIEGLLGEEKRLKRKTTRKDIDIEAEGIGLLCGVSTDLHKYVLGGLIFRVVPILLYHTHDEHSEIGKHIMNNIGSNIDEGNKEEVIREFYSELSLIQSGGHPTIKPIREYFFERLYKEKLFKEWNELTKPIIKEGHGFNFFRELQEGIRILISHAFLNIHHRKCVDGILYPNDEDFKIAMKIMKQTIIFKYRLMKTEKMAQGLSNAKEFVRVMNSESVSEETKNILKNLISIKNGRVVRKEK